MNDFLETHNEMRGYCCLPPLDELSPGMQAEEVRSDKADYSTRLENFMLTHDSHGRALPDTPAGVVRRLDDAIARVGVLLAEQKASQRKSAAAASCDDPLVILQHGTVGHEISLTT